MSSGRRWLRRGLLSIGLACIVSGVVLIVVPAIQLWQRGEADKQALDSWNSGGSSLIAGAPIHADAGDVNAACGSRTSSDYARVSFPQPQQYSYAGIAGDGKWDLLHSRTMVHYHGTPDPGQQGNVIIGFHREPDFEHIDMLNLGDDVKVQDRDCKTFTYRVVQKWVLPPNRVTQLSPTSGHDMTLITCTPWYVDNQRLVWRLSLIN